MKEPLSESLRVPRRAASLVVLLGFLASLAEAQAAGVQMLPPTDFSGNPCADATGGLLQWDGSTPIKCVPGVSGDAHGDLSAQGNVSATGNISAKGNVSAVGTVIPGAATAGQVCSPVGAIAHDTTGAPLNCINGVWTSSSGATGWVTPNCVPIAPPGQPECTSSLSPLQICQNAGYTNFLGACQAAWSNSAAQGGQVAVQGSLIADNDNTVAPWVLACGGTGVNLQILCIH